MSSSNYEVGSLEKQSEDRRQRLENLKKKVDSLQNKTKSLTFRSYELNAQPHEVNPNAVKNVIDADKAIETHVQCDKPETLSNDIDITVLAPRKADWDLKRSIENKLEILDRSTQKAIAELIRERLLSGEHNMLEMHQIPDIDK